jgi:hypothetical protein
MATEYTESIENVIKDTLPQLPGVIRSVVARECRLAMREFFEKSLAWITVVEDIAIPDGDVAIQVDDGDDNTEVIALLRVMIGNSTDGFQDVTPLGRMPDKIEGTASRPWSWYVTSNPDELKLHPYKDGSTTDTLRVTAGLIPAFDTAIDELILPRQITLKFYDAILNGTLARLYMHPNKPYSQPGLGMQLRHNFLRQIGYYAGQRKKGFNNTPMWRYPSGWSK